MKENDKKDQKIQCLYPILVKKGNHYIGYSQLRTNLVSRQANINTMQAYMIEVKEKTDSIIFNRPPESHPTSWTQFAGWSDNGQVAIIGQGWKSETIADLEEKTKTFIFKDGELLYDCWLYHLKEGTSLNVTEINRISFYNTGLRYWPDNPTKLTFQAIINQKSLPVLMNLDGSDKKVMLPENSGFTYGAIPSPDGKSIVYQTDYKIYLEYQGTLIMVDTGYHFNFGPNWSPDGEWIMIVAGKSNKTADHVILISKNGKFVKKVADRGGYKGFIHFLDVPDFHEGSSDNPVWAPDSSCIYLTRKEGDTHDIWKVDLSGHSTRLTNSGKGILNYHPSPSPDGKMICFGSDITKTRQLYIMNTDGNHTFQLTYVPSHHAAMWAYWRPLEEQSVLPPY